MTMPEARTMARVLIVDDEQTIRISFREFLVADGYKVEVAPDAQEALRLLEDHDFDIVVSDIVLPQINGIELLKAIRGASPFAQVIMVTGEPTVETAAEALRAGAFDYLTKPVGKNAILRAVGTGAKVKALDDEMRRLEEANRKHMAQLEKQNAELRQAAAFREEVEQITRHDLKNPLSVIIGSPSVIMETAENLTEEQCKLLEHIERMGYRMLKMINLSLDVFKMEHGMYHLEPKPVDLLTVVQDSVIEYGRLARGKKLSTSVTIDGAAATRENRLLVSGEKLLLYCMMSNLIKNAIEASPEGEDLTVDLEDSDPCAVRVHNKGAVPSGIRDRFFEKLVTSGKTGGTGLGTYSARLVAETHGGAIRLDTSEECATAVTVSLPRA